MTLKVTFEVLLRWQPTARRPAPSTMVLLPQPTILGQHFQLCRSSLHFVIIFLASEHLQTFPIVQMHFCIFLHTTQLFCQFTQCNQSAHPLIKENNPSKKQRINQPKHMLHEDHHQHGPQLPGLTPEHVALVAATGLLLLFAFSYLTSDSSLLIRQSKR